MGRIVSFLISTNMTKFGYVQTPEHRAKSISAASSSRPSRHGIPLSEEHKIKISKSLTGRPKTPEHIKKVAMSNKRNHRRPADQQIANLTPYKIGHPAWNKGKVTTEDTKLKQSIVKLGEKAPNWQGGKSFEPYCRKWTEELRRRIRAFFNYECVTCGKTTEENRRQLCCHHIEYNKQACCDEKPVQFAALCDKCHNKTNYERERWEAMLHKIIDEIYDGKSYLPKL